jgi:biopolymer transport protein ExbB
MRNNAKLFLTLFGIFVFNLAMLAQDNSIGGGEDAAATTNKGGGMPPIPWEFIIPLGILLFYTLYVIYERILYIRRMVKFDAKLVDNMQPHLEKGNIADAMGMVKTQDGAYAAIVKEGLESIESSLKPNEVEANMEKIANIEIGKMDKNLGHLGLIAGIAPTIGFIGTISGVITVFYDISKTENVSIGIISEGLYEKMFSSAAGLIVGLIAYAGYHILNSVIDSNTLRMQQVIVKFTKLTRP